jgi:hypothetical protein
MGQKRHEDIAESLIARLGREALLDAPSQGAAQPLNSPVDGRVHVRSSGP